MDRIIAGVHAAGFLLGAGIVVLGQATFDPTAQLIERGIGGTILLGVGYLVVRAVFRLNDAVRADSEATRQTLEDERVAWAAARLAWQEERAALLADTARYQRELNRAEQTIADLKARGAVDRRTTGS